ncbi:hypothetical protein A0257_00865 [Hymenobacter psoromatis]|nr:hypothetical protein A0257_00865 [Hymenobacter psoromatis]
MKSSLLTCAAWVPAFWLLTTGKLLAQNLNLAFGKSAIATSVVNNDQSHYAAGYATDGNYRTHWVSTATDDQSLTVDLGSVQTIDRIRLSWEVDYARDFNLEVSSDGITYAVVKNITANVPDKRDNLVVNEYGQLGARGRYVRLHCLTQANGNGFAVDELEVFGFTNTTPNLALGKPVRATDADLSGSGYLFQPAFAVDGNSQTRWSTLKTTYQSFVVDLGQAVPFTTLFLNWESAYGVAFQLQTSTDSTTWTTRATYTNNQAYYNEVGVAATGRYVRMLGQQGGQNGGGFSIYELAVYNSPPPLAARAGRARASISLYPNPTASRATLEWDAGTASLARWTLLNSLGQVVGTGQLAARTGHNTQALDLRAYAAGSYLLTLEAAGQMLGRARVQKIE